MSAEPLFNRLALIGTGLIGSSIARAARAQGAARAIVATARSAATRRRVAELGIADQVVETNAAAVQGADLVIACIPVGQCGAVRSEALKFSAGGFRDFTRIAASDPTMWRDVFLANKDAVLEMLGTFNEDLAKLTRAIRRGDGDALFEHFARTRAIRRGIVEIGQDSPAPDFGRAHPELPHEPLPRPYAAKE